MATIGLVTIHVRSTDKLTITSPHATFAALRLGEDAQLVFGRADHQDAARAIDNMITQLQALRRHVTLPGGVAPVQLDGRSKT